MSFSFKFGKTLVPKTGERVSGDTIEVFADGHSTSVVLADGLGSGLISNILSSLTAKMAIGMLKSGASPDDVSEILSQNIPTACKNASVGYSTFTIFQTTANGDACIIEYNNPTPIIGRKNKIVDIPREITTISGKVINKYRFEMDEHTWVVLISDGVSNAGVASIWNHGWGQKRVATYLSRVVRRFGTPQEVCEDLCNVCKILYSDKVTDDVSVAAVFANRKDF